jgi:hypothetical protein
VAWKNVGKTRIWRSHERFITQIIISKFEEVIEDKY